MTKGISKPVDQYVGAVQTHVEVAKQVSLLDSQADEVSSLRPASASTPGTASRMFTSPATGKRRRSMRTLTSCTSARASRWISGFTRGTSAAHLPASWSTSSRPRACARRGGSRITKSTSRRPRPSGRRCCGTALRLPTRRRTTAARPRCTGPPTRTTWTDGRTATTRISPPGPSCRFGRRRRPRRGSRSRRRSRKRRRSSRCRCRATGTPRTEGAPRLRRRSDICRGF